jgi:Fic family protein
MTEEEIIELEIQNGFKQFDYGIEMIKFYLEPHQPFALRETFIQDLQRLAVEGLDPNPGVYRNVSVGINKSAHVPPEPHLVKGHMIEMCDYVNANLHEKSPFHLAAYVMWRHNWIHPFTDGNGRTSRTLSYIVLNILLAYVLPGSPTIPQQIQDDRSGYFSALEEADKAYADTGDVNVSKMEDLLKNMLAKQLLSVIELANGGSLSN